MKLGTTLIKQKKVWLILLALIAINGFGYYYWFFPEEVEAISYQTAKIKQGDLTVRVDSAGVIQYGEETEINSIVNGQIADIFVQEGTEVKAGDPLFSLDSSSLDLQIAQANNDLKIAQLKLADLLQTNVSNINQVNADDLTTVVASQNGVINYNVSEGMYLNNNAKIATIKDSQTMTFKTDVFNPNEVKVGDSVELQFEDFSGGVLGKITKISSAPRSNGVSIVYDVWISIENPGLLEVGMIGEASFTSNDSSFSREGRIDSIIESDQYPKVSGTIEKIYFINGEYVKKGTPILKISNTGLINQIETQKVSISNLNLKLQQLENEHSQLTMNSPMAGLIEELYISPMQTINNNNKVARLVSKELAAKIEVDEIDIPKVQIGQEVELMIQALNNQTYMGTVAAINNNGNVKDGITSYQVFISLPIEGIEGVKSGMTVDASILVAKAANVLSVPNSSIIDVKDGKAVRVVQNDLIKVKVVEVGLQNDTLTEIKSGLDPEDVIITSITIPTSSTSSSTGTSSSLVPNSVSIPGITGGGGRK